MAIKFVKLQNFKGFKEATLELKPLTVILGPNSAGKSSFGQALVALSKNNLSKDRVLSMAFDPISSLQLGRYSDLIHAGCEGKPVMIELGVSSGTLNLGFGGEITNNPATKIGELDLTYIEVGEKTDDLKLRSLDTSTLTAMASEIKIGGLLPNSYDVDHKKIVTLTRKNEKNWTINVNGIDEDYKIFFDGLDIEGVFRLSGTTDSNIFPITPFQDTASLLEKIIYLRPDRTEPRREYKNVPYSNEVAVNDWGDGAVWYVHEYRGMFVDTFSFPHPTSDTGEAQKRLNEMAHKKMKKKRLRTAVSDWLARLGLAAAFETKLINGGRAIQVLAAPPMQEIARPLTDIGFGVSQVLPILVKGLSVKKNGLFVIEQPEAQLHPKPQAELADFFCSMVKCERNVLVETHSEALFHRLRILADMDEDLSQKIAVYFIDEPSIGTDGASSCSQPRRISLKPGDEFKWPTGFLYDGVETEMQVRAIRIAKEKEEG